MNFRTARRKASVWAWPLGASMSAQDRPAQPLNEHVRLNLDVKNRFNEEYEEGTFNFYAYPGAPRTVQAGIAYTF